MIPITEEDNKLTKKVKKLAYGWQNLFVCKHFWNKWNGDFKLGQLFIMETHLADFHPSVYDWLQETQGWSIPFKRVKFYPNPIRIFYSNFLGCEW